MPHFAQRGLELLIAVLKLLYIARHLADLILQTLDPVKKVPWTGLGVHGSLGGHDAQ
jgi:hypothetical protein